MSRHVAPASESSGSGEHMRLVVKNTFLDFEEVDLCQRRKTRRSTTEAVFFGNIDFGNSDAETDVGSASDAFSPRSPSNQSCASEAGSIVQLELAKLCKSGSQINEVGLATERACQCVVEDSSRIQREELVQAIEIKDNNTAIQTWPSPTSIQPTSVRRSDTPGSNAISGLNEPSGAASPSRRRRQWSGIHSLPTFQKEQDFTTVMLRNLPNDYTRKMLMDLLHSRGFKDCFDFIYVPFDFKRRVGLGYAFMNLVSHDEALRAMQDLPGFKEWKSKKVLQVSWSVPLQGLWANVERYRNSPVMHPDVPEMFKPLLLQGGIPVAFPRPTRMIHQASCH